LFTWKLENLEERFRTGLGRGEEKRELISLKLENLEKRFRTVLG